MAKTRRRKQKGGVKSQLFNGDNSQLEHFKSNFDIFYIGAHGSIPVTKEANGFSTPVFELPDNTYVVHIAPAGQACGGGFDEFIINAITYIPGVGKKETSIENIFNLLNGTKEKRKRLNFNRFYNNTNITKDATIGIYEPHDEIPDLILDFKNNPHTQFIEVALLKAPFNHEFFDIVDNARSDIMTARTAADRAQKTLDYESQLYDHSSNLIKKSTQISLRELIFSDLTRSQKENRVFLIFACRSPGLTNPTADMLQLNKNIRQKLAKTLRAQSVERRRNAGAGAPGGGGGGVAANILLRKNRLAPGGAAAAAPAAAAGGASPANALMSALSALLAELGQAPTPSASSAASIANMCQDKDGNKLPSEIPLGSRVIVRGIVSKPDLNNKIGTIICGDPAQVGRVGVLFDFDRSRRSIAVKNITVIG